MTSQRMSSFFARAVIASQLLFTAGWLVAGLIQDGAYSAALHDISDLGALTARAPLVMLLPQAIAGAITVGFALMVLRPALHVAGHRDSIGAWLVAGSLMGLDNITDPLFRLDCRAADAGCTAAVAAASWHGTLHVAFGIAAALMTIIAPFALARRMRLVAAWSDVASRTFGYGVVVAFLMVVYGALGGHPGQGYAQRALCVVISAGLIALAARCEQIGQSSM